MAETISNKPWSQFSESDYTPQQLRRASLIDMGGDPQNKSNYKLRVHEPNGTLNRNGVHTAVGAHGLMAVKGISPEVRRATARKLLSLYAALGERPPSSLLQMAGHAQANQNMRKAAGRST